jgi:hypothetical protein
MFRDELAVVIANSNGVQESYFVPAKDVDQQLNRVRVRVHETESLTWATLPTPDGATISVAKSGVTMT